MERITASGVLTVLLAVALCAQTPRPAAPGAGMYLTAAEMRQMTAAFPGLNAGVKSIDAGAHVVDFWLESRKGGPAPAAPSGIVHRDITEIYYVFQGTASLITGGAVDSPQPIAVNVPAWKGSPVVFNTPTGGGAYRDGTPRRVGPGDIIVIPPGTPHQWGEVDSPMLVYFIARIDPTKTLAAGYLNPVLQGTP
jgi:mannose-6-phosphate isomerase-like protein (cupin superfamily)